MTTFIGIGIVIILVAICLLGFGYIGLKSPQQKVAVFGGACRTEDIDSYNKVLLESTKDSHGTYQALVDDIEKRSSYQDDTVCNYITLRYYLITEDKAKATERLSKLEKSAKNSPFYMPSNAYDIMSISQLREIVSALGATSSPVSGGEG